MADVLVIVLMAALLAIGIAVLVMMVRIGRRQNEIFRRQGEAAEDRRMDEASDALMTVLDKSMNGQTRYVRQVNGHSPAPAARRKRHLTLVKWALAPGVLGGAVRELWRAHERAAYAAAASVVVIGGTTAAVYLGGPAEGDKQQLGPQPAATAPAAPPAPGPAEPSPSPSESTATAGETPLEASPSTTPESAPTGGPQPSEPAPSTSPSSHPSGRPTFLPSRAERPRPGRDDARAPEGEHNPQPGEDVDEHDHVDEDADDQDATDDDQQDDGNKPPREHTDCLPGVDLPDLVTGLLAAVCRP